MKSILPLICALAFAWPAHAADGQSDAASAAAKESQIIELVGESYSFKPDRIVVKANVPVVLRVRKASGIIPHNFVIDAPQAGVQVKEAIGSEPKLVRVTFTAPGEYPYFCSKKAPFGKTHRQRGMEGTIVVTK